ncbi:MAG: CDP-diacylglycerol--serine O-phosphatidyltransferase [Oligoflexia bacterium]|nr:CDP-diacylglycerol--serine O-phosphatidyltransferase [Oligoflexia bacterium]
MRVPKVKRLKLLSRRTDLDPEGRGVHIYILPNLFTTANMFCGFLSMLKAIEGEFLLSAYFIVGAAVFDVLDGRVARLTHATSRFGVEYDSLSDLVSFGVAPAVLMYMWALRPFSRMGWLVCFLYLACAALRLARFNVQVVSIEKKYFQGLPSPMAAGIVATAVTAFHQWGIDSQRNPYLLGLTALLGFVMVSTFRYRSFKDLDFRSKKPFFTLIIGLCVLVFIALEPEVHLFLAFTTYAVVGAIWGVLGPARRRISKTAVAEVSPQSTANVVSPGPQKEQ